MVKKEKTESEKKEVAFGMQVRLANLKNSYMRNIVNGRYHMARCNMLAVQIKTGKIKESIDGCPKSEEFLRAEYAHQKIQAIMDMRNVHFTKQEMFTDFKLTEEDMERLEEDYYNGMIIRESYDESYKKGNKAEFVDTSKD